MNTQLVASGETMNTSEERRGNVLVSEHQSWGSVLNALSRPIKTSVSLYYDTDARNWILGRVMTQDERDASDASNEASEDCSDDYA